MQRYRFVFLLISLSTILVLYQSFIPADGCIRSVCGPVVSKCQLLGSCRCEAKLNATCFKECSYCLKDYYADCCSCVEICPSTPENDTDTDSHADIIEEASPELFEILTTVPDTLARWHAVHEPVQNRLNLNNVSSSITDLNQNGTSKESMDSRANYSEHHLGEDLSPRKGLTTVIGTTINKPNEPKLSTANDTATQPIQCTVAYFASCMEIFKCQQACRTMGASAYRWFDDGCCECVGQYCLNFGINESRCFDCPEESVPEEQEL